LIFARDGEKTPDICTPPEIPERDFANERSVRLRA
jgi:hypothetical protein